MLAGMQIQHKLRERTMQPRDLPFITTNRAPKYAPRLKIQAPRRSPISIWSRALKPSARGSPQRRTSTFAVSSFPSERTRAAG